MEPKYTEFTLLTHKIQIEYTDELVSDHGALGISKFIRQKISIQPGVDGVPLTESAVEHTLWHEIIHFILHYMGETELNANEQFVDLLAGLVVQAKNSLQQDAHRGGKRRKLGE